MQTETVITHPTEPSQPTGEDIKSEISPELEKVIERESTNLQWPKLAMNLGMLVFMFLSKVIRGPGGGEESSFGVKICDPVAWTAFAVMILFALLLTVLAAYVANKENAEKERVGYVFTRGDQQFTTK